MEGDQKKRKRPGKVKSGSYEELWSRPGYLIRRLHQVHLGLFAAECGAEDITPVQFAILTVLRNGEEMDQQTLSTSVGIDRTSGADVIRRLNRRGLVTLAPSKVDRRANLVQITPAGREFAERLKPMVVQSQDRLMAPLTAKEQASFYRLVDKLLAANNDSGRAPMGSV